MTTKKNRVWFITGASKGLGYAYTRAALEAGDQVVAVARTISPLDPLKDQYPDSLLPLMLDVRNRESVFAVVQAAKQHFGRLDIVVNNAGTMTLGMVEELSESDARDLMETNFFGALWVSQAVMPHLREQGSGHIIQISSIGALVSGPMSGMYSASKFALEGLSEALAREAASFGIKLTMVEPGGYWTEMYNALRLSHPIEAYGPLREELAKQYAEGSVDSDPQLAAQALMKLVDSEDPPLRLILGSMVFDAAIHSYEQRIATWKSWETVSRAAEKGIPAPEGYGE
ncbi:SDR family oxidoreductase [Paenibacillus mucilaginosus]|uniref:Putative oxidoreductase n=1 Tax=Paenibacillus mucilaginosus (strain KNP414) TaxID=1036673 RepID=F8F6K8_PAEMK|nr:SDR family oxidoreductase [Paenibacillus mucilaginosus]AEI42962.1 putative oxidoreductase [Paenibacillus mucilaginosus KNP414]MCG7216073.1 SDR family oxidoreductase [Paenibacillus mucilaginosus]WDM24592.1 SDR family oxidoreductase [Paenibacillus mucilaginosus]